MSWPVPAVSAFKAKFVRDFNYAPASAPNDLKFVTDADIQAAYDNAVLNFNSSLFGTDAQTTNVFLYLAAFYLVESIKTSSQGFGSQANFPVNSKSVGGVSIAFTVPDKYLKNPALAIFANNGYGMMYLSLVLPFAVGHVKTIAGTTTQN